MHWLSLLQMERPMNTFVRVAIIDDHPLFREGLVQYLTSAGGIEIVGEGAIAADALRIAQQFTPDVMLLDICLPGNGIDATSAIAYTCPNVRIVMLTASENEQNVVLALQAGARGYILKGSDGSEVVQVVRAIAQGHSHVAPHLAARLLTIMPNPTESVFIDNPHDLTCREAEIFELVARGMSNKGIAKAFNCAERTVKHHMTNIMQKLHVRNRVEVALKFQPKTFRAPVR